MLTVSAAVSPQSVQPHQQLCEALTLTLRSSLFSSDMPQQKIKKCPEGGVRVKAANIKLVYFISL